MLKDIDTMTSDFSLETAYGKQSPVYFGEDSPLKKVFVLLTTSYPVSNNIGQQERRPKL